MDRILFGLGFGKPGGGGQPRPHAADDVIYRASGITILSCVLLAVASNLLPASVTAHWPLLFIFEAIAVFAFGVSWFVKGQTIRVIRARIRRGAPAARRVAVIRELEGQR